MSQVTEFKGRGIQEIDVFTAADALIAEGQAQERALFFGADQLLLQQQSFWNLLAARSITRADQL